MNHSFHYRYTTFLFSRSPITESKTNLSITDSYSKLRLSSRFIPKFGQKLENSFVSLISIQAETSFPQTRKSFPLARQLARPMFQKLARARGHRFFHSGGGGSVSRGKRLLRPAEPSPLDQLRHRVSREEIRVTRVSKPAFPIIPTS